MNGDGLAEVVAGTDFADNPDPNTITSSGSAWVVFGKKDTNTVSLASLGSGGFRIDGQGTSQEFARELGLAGDVNSDGRPDIVVGALFAENHGRVKSGSLYVIYGRSETTTIDTNALGTQGFRVDGALGDDYLGRGAGGAGDFNGDGRADVVGGAENASNNGLHSGSVYVVLGFGQPAFSYPSPTISGTVGAAIAPDTPTGIKRTGTPTFTVSPQLPAGLAIDGASGTISGTPTAAADAAPYTVTMTDLAGSVTQVVTVSATVPTTTTPVPATPLPLPVPVFPGACANQKVGTSAADKLVGTKFGDLIRGGKGNDVISGLAGADCLFGQSGNDTLSGGSGKDKLDGGPGKDKLTGGSGKDTFSGGAGNDTIKSKDGIRETVNCGRGRDKVTADKRDKLVGCEKVVRR
jgi:Ca2+-binding RTX toxin-like protein